MCGCCDLLLLLLLESGNCFGNSNIHPNEI